MSDWGPVFIAVVLFILLTPGLLIQVPGRSRYVEFGNFQTSGVSILIERVPLLLDIEVDMKNNKEQDEEQGIENSMHKNGSHTCFHVHKTDGLVLPWDLQDYPW
ncbi:hypothetical protein Goshw_025888 [Gossypium schwendimanii]|uniref:Uncharacterized protein n=1 Tax=Gossypium schwendimanii TaxID=34291 RepID=A0A7J9MQN9_GOSSC|nr:hypothetical protein [Gossypium schwendimanii]